MRRVWVIALIVGIVAGGAGAVTFFLLNNKPDVRQTPKIGVTGTLTEVFRRPVVNGYYGHLPSRADCSFDLGGQPVTALAGGRVVGHGQTDEPRVHIERSFGDTAGPMYCVADFHVAVSKAPLYRFEIAGHSTHAYSLGELRANGFHLDLHVLSH